MVVRLDHSVKGNGDNSSALSPDNTLLYYISLCPVEKLRSYNPELTTPASQRRGHSFWSFEPDTRNRRRTKSLRSGPKKLSQGAAFTLFLRDQTAGLLVFYSYCELSESSLSLQELPVGVLQETFGKEL